MIRFARAATLAAIALLLTACAATGPKFIEVQASLPALRVGEGRVFFYRDASTMGAALRPDVRLDGQVVGAPQPGSFFFVDRPAGRHTASARTEAETTVDFDLADGDTVYISMRINMGLMVGRPELTLQPPTTGPGALHNLAYIGSIPLVPGRPDPVTAGAVRGGTASQAQRQGRVTMDDLRGLLPAAQGARP